MYMVHLHYLNILPCTECLALHPCRFDCIISTLPGLSAFAYPKVMDCFLMESNNLSTCSMLENLLPDLDSLFSYYWLNEARKTYFCRPTLVVVPNKLTPVLKDHDVVIMNMLERMTQCTLHISTLQHYIEPPIAREASHSACVSRFLALSCLT